MAKISTPTVQNPEKTIKSKEASPSKHVIRNILSYSKALEVKPSQFVGKISQVAN